jgi:hypothetical protein
MIYIINMSSVSKLSNAFLSRASSGVKSVGSRLSIASSGIKSLESTLDSGLNSVMSNSYFYVALRVFLVLYAAFAAPALPKTVALLMDSTIVRILFAVVIVYVAIDDPLSGILLAVAFIITLQTANKFKLYNSSESVLSPHGISWLPSAKQGAMGSETNQSVENVINSGVRQVVGGVGLVGEAASDSVSYTGSGVLSGARTIGSSVVGSARHIGSELLGGTQQIGKGLYVGVEQVGSGLLGGVSTLGGCLLDSAVQVGGGVASGVHSVGSGLVGGARQMGSGVLSGTQELATGLVGGTAQVGSGVWQGVRSLGKPVGLAEHFYDSTAPEGTNTKTQNDFAPFTSDALFDNASSNVVPGANQGSCVQAFENQYCGQGLQSEGVQGNDNISYFQ